MLVVLAQLGAVLVKTVIAALANLQIIGLVEIEPCRSAAVAADAAGFAVRAAPLVAVRSGAGRTGRFGRVGGRARALPDQMECGFGELQALDRMKVLSARCTAYQIALLLRLIASLAPLQIVLLES